MKHQSCCTKYLYELLFLGSMPLNLMLNIIMNLWLDIYDTVQMNMTKVQIKHQKVFEQLFIN